jgi:hypothetical protein
MVSSLSAGVFFICKEGPALKDPGERGPAKSHWQRAGGVV